MRTLAQFQGSEMSSGLFQDFKEGYIKLQDRGALNKWWSVAESLIYGQLKLNLFIALAKIPEREGSISRPSPYGFLFVTSGGLTASGLPRASWRNLVRVECSSVLNFRGV